MSKATALIVLVMAVLAGLFASVTVMKYIKEQRDQLAARENADTVMLVMAKEEIPAGTTIRAEHLDLTKRKRGTFPQGTFNSKNEIVGRMVKSAILKEELVVNDRLVEPGSPGGLPALIPKGLRAITLRVDDTISVGGFVQPGHHVDVVTTVDVIGSTQRETISKVILQNIRVIATGQEIERKDENKAKVVPTVTVLVTLDQAERLSLAANAGSVRLVLRNHQDDNEIMTAGVRLSNLIMLSDNDQLPPPSFQSYEEPVMALPTPVQESVGKEETQETVNYDTVEIIKGAVVTTKSFPTKSSTESNSL